jgi:hypothetical protein
MVNPSGSLKDKAAARRALRIEAAKAAKARALERAAKRRAQQH